jgi:hypothetical protein
MIVVLKLFLLDSKENVSLFATILFLVAGFCYALLPFFAIGNDEVDV